MSQATRELDKIKKERVAALSTAVSRSTWSLNDSETPPLARTGGKRLGPEDIESASPPRVRSCGRPISRVCLAATHCPSSHVLASTERTPRHDLHPLVLFPVPHHECVGLIIAMTCDSSSLALPQYERRGRRPHGTGYHRVVRPGSGCASHNNYASLIVATTDCSCNIALAHITRANGAASHHQAQIHTVPPLQAKSHTTLHLPRAVRRHSAQISPPLLYQTLRLLRLFCTPVTRAVDAHLRCPPFYDPASHWAGAFAT